MYKKLALVFGLLFLMAGCNNNIVQSSNKEEIQAVERAKNLLPTPEKILIKKGFFHISPETKVVGEHLAPRALAFLQNRLRLSSGYSLKTTEKIGNNTITFHKLYLIPEEAYLLFIDKNGIRITAGTASGFFYGIQSLLQLMDTDIWKDENVQKLKWTVAAVEIEDHPKHQWRSFMLDSGREYQSPEFIKNYLDYLAMLKMNVFHWHLTEGQGWRIEIKKYPQLTTIGSSVAEGPSKGKYYTRKEIKDIIQYAADRFITVVPEIDVPGHSQAALIAYPEYTCSGKAPESVMGFSPHIFCAGKDKTYSFLKDILDEVCELFPSKYIHLGGDEAPKKEWKACSHCQQKIKENGLKNEHELQIYFTNQLAAHLKQKGRKAICWGDVVHQPGPKLEDNIVIYWWNWRRHKDKALQESIKQGIPIICGTNYYSYLNFPVTPWSKYNKNRTFDLKTTYEQNPSNLSEEAIREAGNILGMGTCQWTDWYVYEHMIDRRVFPRIYSLAEQMWHRGEALHFETFYSKVKAQYTKLNILGIDYGPAMEVDITPDFSWE